MQRVSCARRACVVARASSAVKVAPAARPVLLAINITKSNLVGSQGGRAVRNVDGSVYELVWREADSEISVIDQTKRLEFVGTVGEKDNRISIDLASGIPLPGPPSFSQLQAALRADGPAPEALNGRLAMVAFLATSVVELASGQGLLAQAASPAGAAAAVALAAAVAAASLAPVYAGKARIETAFPSPLNSYADSQLPYYFSPLAEAINGRMAMLGMAGLLITELVRGGAPLF